MQVLRYTQSSCALKAFQGLSFEDYDILSKELIKHFTQIYADADYISFYPFKRKITMPSTYRYNAPKLYNWLLKQICKEVDRMNAHRAKFGFVGFI